MTTTEMDVRTDIYAKSDSTSFPLPEKLAYYNEADGILNGLIIQQQEDRGESEPTSVTTVAGQHAYPQPSRIHHINWLKIDYGSGAIPARYKPEAELINEYGNGYTDELANWDQSYPIYFFKGSNLHVYPAATVAQAGVGRLTYSVELLPVDLDRSGNTTPTLVPVNYHHLHPAYAAMQWLDEGDSLWAKAKRKWDEAVGYPDRDGTWIPGTMLETMYPRTRQQELLGGYPEDNGYDY